MGITFDYIKHAISKFLHLRWLREDFRLLDYSKINPEKTLIFDVDCTILIAKNRDYVNAKPIEPMIKKINKLHSFGWTIILYTARGQLSKNGNMRLIEEQNRPVLEDWLQRHNVSYDYLIFYKPYGAYYIDDKALTPWQFLRTKF